MKLLLEVNDTKSDFVLELLKNLSFVKTTTISPAKAQFLKELKEAVAEVKLVKRGKLATRDAKELLNEL